MATPSFQLLNTELQQRTQHPWLGARLERTWLSEVATPGMEGQVHQAVNHRHNNHLAISTWVTPVQTNREGSESLFLQHIPERVEQCPEQIVTETTRETLGCSDIMGHSELWRRPRNSGTLQFGVSFLWVLLTLEYQQEMSSVWSLTGHWIKKKINVEAEHRKAPSSWGLSPWRRRKRRKPSLKF